MVGLSNYEVLLNVINVWENVLKFTNCLGVGALLFTF